MSTPTPGGFSLFPSPNSSKPPPVSRNQTPKPRRSESRERRAPTPSDRRAATPQAITPETRPASPRNGRQTPQNRAHTPIEFEPVQSEPPKPVKVQRPRPTVQIPGRSDTGFAQGNTLV